ncbi:hypothetical protein F511_16319 [Dorcoceras hygrometricum]|uniref:Uncharacterized protein n=1 Tax=Dorcoceras hygrometricum TaxID=472368 RepID=A0A2Z7AUI3_9LAMI|nr:hypothetical protein F511_16319 [Dorcoceras hygrometricum]
MGCPGQARTKPRTQNIRRNAATGIQLAVSTTIGKSRVARDPITMHTSSRSNSDITSVTRQTHLPKTHPILWPEIYHTIIFSDSIGYPCMTASGESSTTKHRLLHASGPHPIPPPNDPKRSYSGSSRNAKIFSRNVLSIQTQEDSGEAFEVSDASNSSIQSKSLYESAVAMYSVARYSVQSQEIQAQITEEVAKCSSRGDKSAAKQLTTYEESSKLDVNC